MTGRISPRTCYTKLNFDFSYVRFLSLRRDTYLIFRKKKLKINDGNNLNVVMDNITLTKVNSFKYFGVIVGHNLN